MNILKRLFGSGNTGTSTSDIEDLRSSASEEGEVIFNLWYVTNRYIISSLRAKRYIASGTDDYKLQLLRERANHDYLTAEAYPVPEELKADVKLFDGSTGIAAGKACTHDMLEMMGGYPALFREFITNTPKTNFRFDPAQAMFCITGLAEDEDGNLSVQIDFSKEL